MKAAPGTSASGIEERVTVADGLPADSPPFVAAAAWHGCRPGYVFKADERGVGYYIDRPPARAEPLDVSVVSAAEPQAQASAAAAAAKYAQEITAASSAEYRNEIEFFSNVSDLPTAP